MEIFKDVPGYEGIYQISDLGNVYSQKRFDSIGRKQGEKFLKKVSDGLGYHNVVLSKNGIVKTVKVQYLVAMCFMVKKPNGENIVLDHKDNNGLNNQVNNLQWITNRENVSKDKKGYSSKYIGVCWNKKSKKWEAGYRKNGKKYYLGLFIKEIDAHKIYLDAIRS